ncbi:MAG: acyltransferase [Halothiobacillaceae bacterium]|nr:acyltransferase [Halothiobacillaceae bacterium]
MNAHQEGNQFNFLRFFAAFLVFYGHQYILSGSWPGTALSHNMGVYIFFVISGYLISMSWDKDPSLGRFFIKRSVRIFPALFVCVLLSVFVLGPAVSSLSVYEYFESVPTWVYLGNVFLHVSYYLPGVFEGNPHPNSVNGSLWSLPVEFLMYILVAVLGVLLNSAKLVKYSVLFVFLVFLLLTKFWALDAKEVIVFYGMDLKTVIYTGVFFWAGALMYHLKAWRYFTFEIFVLSLLVFLFSLQWGEVASWLQYILVPLLVLSFGFSSVKVLRFFNKADYSYGLYIYAFPVQQFLVFVNPGHLYWNLFIGFAVTLVFAALSWHWVEKPFLAMKPKRK